MKRMKFKLRSWDDKGEVVMLDKSGWEYDLGGVKVALCKSFCRWMVVEPETGYKIMPPESTTIAGCIEILLFHAEKTFGGVERMAKMIKECVAKIKIS